MNFGVAAVRDAPRGAHTQSTAERTDTPHAHTCKEGSEQQQEQGLRRWRRTPTHDAVHTQTRRAACKHKVQALQSSEDAPQVPGMSSSPASPI